MHLGSAVQVWRLKGTTNQSRLTKSGRTGELREKKACIKKRGIRRSSQKVLTADFLNTRLGYYQLLSKGL